MPAEQPETLPYTAMAPLAPPAPAHGISLQLLTGKNICRLLTEIYKVLMG